MTTAADEPVRAVLAAAADTCPLDIALLTDEELFAHSGGDDPDAGPYGVWFGGLEQRDRRIAAAGAMRALTSRGEVGVAATDEAQVELPDHVAAVLELRTRPPLLSLRVVRPGDDSWYVLRHAGDGLYLRELVSGDGFHSLSLVRLDDDERDLAIARLGSAGGAEDVPAPEVDVTLTEAQLDGASVGTTSVLSFLDDTTAVGHVVRVPGGDGIGTSMVHAQPDGTVVIGDVVDRTVRYRGASRVDLRAAWDTWLAPVRALETGD